MSVGVELGSAPSSMRMINQPGPRLTVVPNVAEKMHLVCWQEESSCYRVHWSITPALIAKSACAVQAASRILVRAPAGGELLG